MYIIIMNYNENDILLLKIQILKKKEEYQYQKIIEEHTKKNFAAQYRQNKIKQAQESATIKRNKIAVFKRNKNATINRNKNATSKQDIKFVFIISSYNNAKWVQRNLNSINNQSYTNWRVIYVDDASTDNTYKLVNDYIKSNNLRNKFIVIKNEKNYKQAYSRYIAFKKCYNDEICCLLDGDDWLYDMDVLYRLKDHYQQNNVLISYGQYMIYENGKQTKLTGVKVFPKKVIEQNAYQHYPLWISVHLRTGYAKMFKSYPYKYLLDFNDELMSVSTDQNEMFWVLNKSKGKHANTGFITLTYNKDASKQNENSYYNINNNKKQQLYRTELDYFLRLNQLNRYEKEETILIFTDLKVCNKKLQQFCDLINFKYKLIFKNELLDGINDINININYILFYHFNSISKELIELVKQYSNEILSNTIVEDITLFNDDDIFLKLKKYNYQIIKKNYKEYNDLYNYSIIVKHDYETSPVNNYVDKVYCINLIKDNKKLESFINMVKKYKINCEILRMTKLVDSKIFMLRYKETNYKYPGELGCLVSHLICCIDAKNNNYNNIIILEEDCIPKKNLNDCFISIKNIILDKSYVYLGSSQWHWSKYINMHNNYYNAWRSCGSFAIYINKNMISLLISQYSKMDKNVDEIMHDYYNTPPNNYISSTGYYGFNKKSLYYGKCIVLYPNLFIADVTNSNIRNPQNMVERSKRMKWNLNLYDI
jgi:glycosyltransferase involved in cell wall biosynthesis